MVPTASLSATFGERLRQARAMRGWSLRALADRLGGRVSHTTLNQLEKGLKVPGSEILLALVECLGQEPDFFFRPVAVRLEGIDFRKKSTLGKKEINKVREEAAAHFERYLELEELCEERTTFRNPVRHPHVANEQDAERAAMELRASWCLGHDPIPNVLELLEQNGVKVHLLDGPDTFFGFSGMADTIPVVVLNRRQPGDRMRLTALHELGHLVLEIAEGLNEETSCHRFAGSMLFPTDACRAELHGPRSTVSFPELLSLKKRWGMSMAAIGKRAQQAGILSDANYTAFARVLSARGWRTNEPGDVLAESVCRFERLLFRALSEGYISLSKGAELSGRSMDDLRKSLQGLP